MLRSGIVFLMAVGGVLCPSARADLWYTVTPATGVSFQNEGTVSVDDTSPLAACDGIWAPSTSGSVSYDFYATGTAISYWDAVSLTFDLGSTGHTGLAAAELRFYLQQGEYYSQTYGRIWHHYAVLEGGFNATYQDAPVGMSSFPIPSGPGIVDFGDHGDSGLVGWLSAPIPLSWISNSQVEITLRLWNARLDTVELRTQPVPAPGAALLGGLGLGYSAWRMRRGTR